MQKKHLQELISPLKDISISDLQNPLITSISYDSREVEENGIFFALKGVHTDGHDYIKKAVDAGATAVVHSDPVGSRSEGVTYICVPDTRMALSPIAAEYWNHPSKELTVIGVTGTDGKSTTVSLICQLLEFTGALTGSLSTVNFSTDGKTQPNPYRQSTPEAPHLHELLRAMVDAGRNYAVLEATSHGLSPRNSRLADVNFDVGVLTNITSEHLEFHGDLETYITDKTRLFQMIATSQKQDPFGVVNSDDLHADRFLRAADQKPIYTYSLKDAEADLYASNLYPDPLGTSFTLHTPWGESDARINLPGIFNLENCLAALCTVAELVEGDPLDFIEVCPKLVGIKGRMETIQGNMDFHVKVDYAHSPGSFTKLLPFLKTMTKGQLIILFGSAGERDTEKRPEQGKIASEFGDVLFLTDEDPREEESMKILDDIAEGVIGLTQGKDLFIIPDRREAIREAFAMAKAGDLVVTLGKGHEQSIIYADGPRPWNEVQVCREILLESGYEVE